MAGTALQRPAAATGPRRTPVKLVRQNTLLGAARKGTDAKAAPADASRPALGAGRAASRQAAAELRALELNAPGNGRVSGRPLHEPLRFVVRDYRQGRRRGCPCRRPRPGSWYARSGLRRRAA